MSHKKLPADPLSMILGIISLLIGIGSCCFSLLLFPFAFIAIVPLLISIIGLVSANRSLRSYRKNPEIYSESSKNNVRTGRVINGIVILFSVLSLLVVVIGFVAYGRAFFDAYNQAEKGGVFERFDQNLEDAYPNNENADTTNYNQHSKKEIILDTLTIDREGKE